MNIMINNPRVSARVVPREAGGHLLVIDLEQEGTVNIILSDSKNLDKMIDALQELRQDYIDNYSKGE